MALAYRPQHLRQVLRTASQADVVDSKRTQQPRDERGLSGVEQC